jgi:hypothetical protein
MPSRQEKHPAPEAVDVDVTVVVLPPVVTVVTDVVVDGAADEMPSP